MAVNSPRKWRPAISIDIDWIVSECRRHARSYSFSVFSHGTIVFHEKPMGRSREDVVAKLTQVAEGADFKVRPVSSETYLVTFRGGVGAVIPAVFLGDKKSALVEDALTHGLFPGEDFVSDMRPGDDTFLLAVGVMARANLYADALDKILVFSE